MDVKDKELKVYVSVCEKDCPNKECYWPRVDPGVFTQGVGYRTRNPGKKDGWLCGTREIHGCPSDGTCLNCQTSFVPGRKVCAFCGQELHTGGKVGITQE